VDHLVGGRGRDFIYASHGRNTIEAGSGNDYVKAHFGRGVVDCGGGNDTLYISHRAQRKYRIRHCDGVAQDAGLLSSTRDADCAGRGLNGSSRADRGGWWTESLAVKALSPALAAPVGSTGWFERPRRSATCFTSAAQQSFTDPMPRRLDPIR
jgi:hypothetical protein